jgi:hypothetical protein
VLRVLEHDVPDDARPADLRADTRPAAPVHHERRSS